MRENGVYIVIKQIFSLDKHPTIARRGGGAKCTAIDVKTDEPAAAADRDRPNAGDPETLGPEEFRPTAQKSVSECDRVSGSRTHRRGRSSPPCASETFTSHRVHVVMLLFRRRARRPSIARRRLRRESLVRPPPGPLVRADDRIARLLADGTQP